MCFVVISTVASCNDSNIIGSSEDPMWLLDWDRVIVGIRIDECQAHGLQPPAHLFSNLLHYANDPPGHAGLHCCPKQVSKVQPLLAVQYRSMSELECRSMSGEGYRSTEGLCCRSIGVSENLSTGLVLGSTVVDQNRVTRKCCCWSIGSALPYGSCVPNLRDLVRI
ncbi:hypothetical protein IGI04_035884 [Brassica rapa subsp. trilocularis]|uniref:Uncharacterized protein n=1 Tax=Brassica rapa subsp. trilocularis TaxID=1813537 RepID=A0ABQ7LCY0_BRACM|nr:hypothetical protein IGI04_035884 [Brassica rapa subsp. trilocularis]